MNCKRILSVMLCLLVVFLSVQKVDATSSPIEVQLKVEKQIDGDKPVKEETFTFKIEAVDQAPMPETNTITISGEDIDYFPPITYIEPGDYYYSIHEIAGTAEGYTYDDTVYYVTVQILTDDDGVLSASIFATPKGTGYKTGSLLFTNTYKNSDKHDETSLTGDNSQIVFWSVVSIISIAAIVILLIISKKNKKKI